MKSKLSVVRSILLSVLLLLTFNAALTAQTVTGTIKGTVVDTNGGLIVGASVEITNVETGLRRSLTTNEDGSYQATFLPLGRYSVSVNQSGFAIVKQ
jgi:protocatechuate 3,4-dioxygenase beta subunit